MTGADVLFQRKATAHIGCLTAQMAYNGARASRGFQSSICLKVNDRVADARSILALLLLCDSFGPVVDLEVSGAPQKPQ